VVVQLVKIVINLRNARRSKMLSGRYRCGVGTDVDVKETSKMYRLRLVAIDAADWCPHLEQLFFNGVDDVRYIRKESGNHKLIDWGDDTFTIYPYRAGIPYYFKRI
jgi:hypothetical protein